LSHTEEEEAVPAVGSNVVEPLSQSDSFRYTLLIVEDNAEMRKFLQKQLAESYKVFVASNGVEALKILQTSIVNLVLSDIMMPEMDGLELCNVIKSDLNYSHIPVILLTAKTTLQSKIEGMKAGADAYVEKPFSMEYLKVCISNLLKNREQLQATFVHAPFVQTNSMAITKADEEFLKKLNEIVQANIQNPDFSLLDMADQLCMSRSILNTN
jgi:DNA-binding response OmpR family regulator